MISQNDILNMATNYLRQESVINFDTDLSIVAESLRIHYHQAVNSLLCQANWTFAVICKVLNEVELDDNGEYELSYFNHKYEIPVDFLRKIDVLKKGSSGFDGPLYIPQTKYEFALRYIYSNEESLYLKYIASNYNTNYYSSSFIDALAFELAIRGCNGVLGSNEKIAILERGKQESLKKAISENNKVNPIKYYNDTRY